METNSDPVKQILDELFSILEGLETQSLAVLQLLKDEGIGTEEKLVPYLDRAGNASSVKWRAARARMHYLLSPIPKETKDKDKETEKQPPEKQAADNQVPAKESAEKQPSEKQPAENQPSEKPAGKEGPGKNSDKEQNAKPAPPNAAKESKSTEEPKRK